MQAMQPGVLVNPTSLTRGLPSIAVCNRKPLYVKRVSLNTLGLHPSVRGKFRYVRSVPPAESPPRPHVAAAAAAASSAFSDDNDPTITVKRRLQRLLASPYDKEIWSVALPALVVMLLEPIMNAINVGIVGTYLGTHHFSALSLGTLAVVLCNIYFTFLLSLTVPEIAAAVVKKDDDEVSRIAAKNLWIAMVCGVICAAAMHFDAEAIVGLLNPPEVDVAVLTKKFIKVRSLGIPAALLGYVATAVFRGFKDTRTPLFGAMVSAATSLGLNIMFLYVFKMGVVGSALADITSQVFSCSLLLGVLLGSGKVQPRHLTRPPSLAAMLPILKLGAVLGARNMISFGMVVYASMLSVRLGSTCQASFEVVRQVWLLAIQFVECLNVATQALCATYLGKEDRATASTLLSRLLTLSVAIGAMVGVAVWLLQGPLITHFTRDPEVVTHVLNTLPLICIFFPIDAAASIMDGSLLAAKQSNYMSVVQIAGSIVQYFALCYIEATGNVNCLTVWSALKMLMVFRVAAGIARNFLSPQSAYATVEASATSEATAVAVEPGAIKPTASVTAVLAASTRVVTSSGEKLATAACTVSEPAGDAVSPSISAALQSFEDDVIILACAACTSATNISPDLLRLKQRQTPQLAVAAAAVDSSPSECKVIGSAIASDNDSGSGGAFGADVTQVGITRGDEILRTPETPPVMPVIAVGSGSPNDLGSSAAG